MSRTLLLNANWEPLHFISDWRAVRLLMNGRGEVIYDFVTGVPAVWDEAFTSPGPDERSPLKSIAVPATLRLRKFVNKRWKAPRFRKNVLFNRDNWQCQYCGGRPNRRSMEVEHVLPVSRGGKTTWLNCVAACHSCNKRKDNKTPEEAGMPLLKKPAVPTTLHFWDSAKSNDWHPSWEPFIPRT